MENLQLLYFSADNWRRERKLLNHTFSPSVIQSIVPIFNTVAIQSVEQLNAQLNGQEFDIHHFVSEAVMKAVLSNIMSFYWNYFFINLFVATTYGEEFSWKTTREFVCASER